ncbi:MAG TPA: hypothetical protein PKC67_12160, partial [Kiritimatiellia bacterium]|nr:hypothetical protein [Kiritimatiellia bacterium]HMP35092.1 hypothetical protein [Kiritimatiellia bacterium]
ADLVLTKDVLYQLSYVGRSHRTSKPSVQATAKPRLKPAKPALPANASQATRTPKPEGHRLPC